MTKYLTVNNLRIALMTFFAFFLFLVLSYSLRGICIKKKIVFPGYLLFSILNPFNLANANPNSGSDASILFQCDFTSAMVTSLPSMWTYLGGTENVDYKVYAGKSGTTHSYYMRISNDGSGRTVKSTLINNPKKGFFKLSFDAKSDNEVSFFIQLVGEDWKTHLVYKKLKLSKSWATFEYITDLLDDTSIGGFYILFDHNVETGTMDIDNIQLEWYEPDQAGPGAPKIKSVVSTSPSAALIEIDNFEKSDDFSHYVIFRDGKEIATTKSNSFLDTSLVYLTTYQYNVGACDVFDNVTKSASVSVTTKNFNTVSINGKDVFLNGINIPIVIWYNDLLPEYYREEAFDTIFRDIHDAGGNSVRWWLFYNMETMPQNSNNLFYKITDDMLDNMESALTLAKKHEIIVNPCFFSFEIASAWGDRAKYFNTDAGIQNIIDSIIVPVVSRFHDNQAIGIWEIINELEWVVTNNSRVDINDLQRFCGKIAAAIHKIDINSLVTTGNAMSRDIEAGYYSDEALKNASGENLGYFDVYHIHYYDWMHGAHFDPWVDMRAEDYDKPVIIGEVPNNGDQFHTVEEMYIKSVDRGYAGVWGWMYYDVSDDRHWPSGKSAIELVASRLEKKNANTTKGKLVDAYPNPASTLIQFKLDNIEEIKVYDTQARLVHKTNNNTLQAELLSPGVYVATLTTTNKEVFTSKIIVCR